jgi:hypothetical protein
MSALHGTQQPNDRTGRSQQTSSDEQQEGLMDSARDAQGTMAQTAQETVDTAKETAQQTMGMAKETAQQIGDQTQQQATEMIGQVAEQVSQTASDLKDQANSSFAQQRDRTVQGLTALADALREAGRNLSNKTESGAQQEIPAAIAPLIGEAADRLQQSAQFLRDKEMGGLLSEAQSLARKQPLLFMGAMFGLGIVGARLVKDATSTADGSGQQSETGGQSGQESSMRQSGASQWNRANPDAGEASTPLSTGTTAPNARQVGNARTQSVTGLADWQDADTQGQQDSGRSFGEGLNETLPTGSAGVPTPNETPSGSEKVR